MASRTPSFVVVGLLLISFLLGFFYMSCSSKTTDLQRTVDDFESRIRTLMVKNADKEKEYDQLNSQKKTLSDEKSNLKKELEKKDSDLNDINTKLNERLAELRRLKTDKQVLDERLKEYRNASESVASQNFAINRLKQELDEQKKNNNEQVNRLKGEIDTYKNKFNDTKDKFIDYANQRFKPLLSANETIKNTSSFIQEPLAKLNDMINKTKDKFAPVVADVKQQFLKVFDNENHSKIDQNIPPPPLNVDKEQPFRGMGRAGDIDNQQQNNIDTRRRRPRLSMDNERIDPQGSNIEDNQKNLPRPRRGSFNDANVANGLDNTLSHLSRNNRNYRIFKREESQKGLLNNRDHNQVIPNQDDDRRREDGRGNLL